MLSKLEVLKKTAENNDSEKTVELLAELVPTFATRSMINRKGEILCAVL